MSRSIAVIAAHPDDEVLGCGGTVAKHVKQGDRVYSLVMAEGATSRAVVRDRKQNEVELNHLEHSLREAARVLGVSAHKLLQFPDNRMDSVDLLDVVKEIEKFIAEFKPELVYTHHASDVNIDHQIVHDAVITACRSLPGASVKTILCFETPSSTEWQTADSRICFIPNWFENIIDTLALKMAALRCYQQEMRPFPHPRSFEAIEYLARWRGATVGVQAAEAFVLSRMVNN